MGEAVRLEVGTHAAMLTLNQPESRNALSVALLEGLHAHLGELERGCDRHVLVLTGAGRAFCAGMDLKAVLGEPGLIGPLLQSLAEVCLRLRALPMVTIARLNGPAVGGGCGLAMVCDFVVSARETKVGFPEVDLGACPAVVAPWLVRKIGAGMARRVLLGGGVMSASEAHALGMVSHLVEGPEGLDPAVQRLVESLAAGGPEALRVTKALLNDLDGSLDADLAWRGAELSARVFSSEEAQARIRARFGEA